METITFRCTACKHVLKIGADKAGRKAKCVKCGTPLIIPASSDPEEKEPALAPVAAKEVGEKEPVMAPSEALVPKKDDDDDDEGGPMTYEIKDDVRTNIEERDKKTPIMQGPGFRIAKKLSKITNAKQWVRVAFGLQVVAAGLSVWLGAYLLYRLPLVLGLGAGEEYAAQADQRLVTSPPESGKPADMDYTMYAVALLSGNSMAGFMIWMVRLSQVAYLLMYFLLITGYILCLAAPPRGGTRLQLTVLLCLALSNALFGIAFKLLPLLGAYEYTILPAVVPEIEMISMNAERIESIYTFWLHWPFLEIFWTLLLNLLFYLEPAMIAVFLRAVAKGLKSDVLEAKAMKLMRLAFSQLYIQLAWMLMALCGTSEVLLTVLRVVYTIGVGFFIGQLVYTIIVLFTVPSVVYAQLGDEAERLLAQVEEEDETAVADEAEEEEEDED
jgi:hypothetical protein